MTRIRWSDPVRDLFLDLPERDRELISEDLRYLRRFPHLYPVRTRGRFRRYRWFRAGNWLVYYRVVGKTVYIRGLWPARIP
jgi:mRNA-degrading endonuclease RelE of RelBE toxin-antitoxin system